MEQILYKLPNSWHWETLTDVTQFIGGSQPPKSEFSDAPKNGYVRLIQIRDYKTDAHIVYVDKNSTKKFCESDDVMIGRYGPPVFQILRGLEGAYNVALMKAVPDEEALSKDYLFDFLQSSPIQNYIIGLSQRAAGQSGVNKKALENYKIPIPPLTEQKRIVEKLDALLTRIDTAVEHLQKSVALADSLALNGLDVYFAELSEAYEECPLINLVDFISGYAFKSGDFVAGTGVKPIKITNVGVTEFSDITEEFLPVDYKDKFNKFSVKNNDIVIALTRPIINGGLKVCRVPESYDGALVNQRVAAITSENKNLLDFIYWYLQSSKTKNYILEKSKSLNQPNLSITDLKNLTLPFPANQQAIEKAIIDCNDLTTKTRRAKAEVINKIDLLNKLKSSILDSAFKGQL